MTSTYKVVFKTNTKGTETETAFVGATSYGIITDKGHRHYAFFDEAGRVADFNADCVIAIYRA